MNEKKHSVVSSPRDPRFLNLRSLQTRQGRSRTKLFIIEGIRHLARAVEHCAPIESIFLDPSVLSNPFGQKLARRLRRHGIPGVRLSRELYRDLTLATEPQGIGAVLHAGVLGTDVERARRVASQIRAGRVVINGMTDDPQAPWGGFKYSGVGREYGRYGMEAFLETRAILES
jgi:tRNA G18 (ribose-2'-O)-methylase SpoU